MNHEFLYMEDIPDPEKNPEFWSTLDSPHHRSVVNFLILNRLRGLDPTQMDIRSIRSELSKLKQLQELLDAMKTFKSHFDEPDKPEDELNEE